MLFIRVCSQESAKKTEAYNMEGISTVNGECNEGYLMTFTILSAYKILWWFYYWATLYVD